MQGQSSGGIIVGHQLPSGIAPLGLCQGQSFPILQPFYQAHPCYREGSGATQAVIPKLLAVALAIPLLD